MGHRCRAWKQCFQQLRLLIAGHPQNIHQLPQNKRPPVVIIAKLKHPAKSSSDFQTRAHASPPAVATPSKAPAIDGQESRHASSLSSHAPAQQLRLHVVRPASTHQRGAEKQAQPPKKTSKPRRKSKTRRLHEGSDADGAAITRFSPLDERARG